MISKPLFKQSCKANGLMWLIITGAVCFMLSCVMIIGGNGDLSTTKEAIQDTTIQGELESQTQKRALNYYELSYGGLQYFDSEFKKEVTTIKSSETFGTLYVTEGEAVAQQYLVSTAYTNAIIKLNTYTESLSLGLGYEPDSVEAQEIKGCIMYVMNPMQDATTYMFDSFYQNLNEATPRYDYLSALSSDDKTRNEYISDYALNNSAIFLAGNMIQEANINQVLEALQEYGVTKDKFISFGYTDYTKIKNIAQEVLLTYTSNLSFRLDNMKEGETVESIKNELNTKFTTSFLSSLPDDVSSALKDIGGMDLYGILVGSIFFKIAGLLLPIIYVIMVSNNLIANQVDSGSMAYILSTSTKRKTVSITQMLYLIGSLFLMFVLTTVTSIICINIVNVETTLNAGKLILINLGAFVVMFAMSGISFLASSFFNRSKKSMAIGGGLNIFFLVATILGLFGTSVIPQIIRMDALNYFNYASLITLFDVISILNGTTAFIWKLSILLGIGIICYVLSVLIYKKKDLPL